MIERNVHHQGKNPTRSALAAPVLAFNGKWSAAFDVFRSYEDQECKVSSITSGALFDSAEAAYEAGGRALDVLQETDKFPNMCEMF